MNSQLGHRCRAVIRGKLIYFTARHIKVIESIEPSCIDHDVSDSDIGDQLLVPVRDQPLPGSFSGDDVEVPQQPFESGVEPVIEYDGKSNPPIRFYRSHGWTVGCTACKQAETKGSAHGHLHSRKCRDRYMEWLKQDGSRSGLPDVVAGNRVDNNYAPSIAPAAYPKMFPEGLDEQMPNPASSSLPAASAVGGGEKRFRLTEKSVPERIFVGDRSALEDIDMADGNIVGGDGVMDVDANISNLLSTLIDVNPMWDGSFGGFFCSNVFSEEGILCPIKYNDSLREELKLCGTTVWQSVPIYIRDEGTQKILDVAITLKAIKREHQHITEKGVGDCCDGSRARELANEWGCKIIGTRWVLGQKFRYLENGAIQEEVRVRCVVQDCRAGTSAVMNGYSRPTTSMEALKVSLAIAGKCGKACLSTDVSTAYMSSPLPERAKAVIRLPSGTSFRNGDPVFMVLRNALNGLRPAALAWVLYFRKVVHDAFGLKSSPHDPTMYIGKAHDGSWVAVLTYVEDILFFGKDLEICRTMLKKLQESIEIKETGFINVPGLGGGELSFLGRRFIRRPGENAILVTMTQEFSSGLSKICPNLKPVDILQDVKPILESQEMVVLSPETQTELRSLIGRLLWMGPFRPDINVALSMVSCGQSEPQQRHEKAAKALLKYCLDTIAFAQRFPVLSDEEYLFHAGEHAFSSLVTFSDASYAPMRSISRKSVSGAVILFMGSKCFCRAQGAVTLSSAEAELEALAAAVQESLGIFKNPKP